MCILWEYKPNFGHFFSTFSPTQGSCAQNIKKIGEVSVEFSNCDLGNYCMKMLNSKMFDKCEMFWNMRC